MWHAWLVRGSLLLAGLGTGLSLLLSAMYSSQCRKRRDQPKEFAAEVERVRTALQSQQDRWKKLSAAAAAAAAAAHSSHSNNSSMSIRISVVVPAYNERAKLLEALAVCEKMVSSVDDIEFIIVDPGSSDDTFDAVTEAMASKRFQLPIKLIRSASGRAAALNAGADAATGDILLFLHADTTLPASFDELIRDTVRAHDVVSGAFSFSIDRSSFSSAASTPRGLALLEWFTNRRARKLMLPYGDQAMFMSTAVFRAVGGFPAMPMMEDFELSRILRDHARALQRRVHIVSEPALCSGRRWQNNGVLWNTLLNHYFVFSYAILHKPADQIFQAYYGRPVAKS